MHDYQIDKTTRMIYQRDCIRVIALASKNPRNIIEIEFLKTMKRRYISGHSEIRAHKKQAQRIFCRFADQLQLNFPLSFRCTRLVFNCHRDIFASIFKPVFCILIKSKKFSVLNYIVLFHNFKSTIYYMTCINSQSLAIELEISTREVNL